MSAVGLGGAGHAAAVFGVGVLAGGVNAVAGGGTVLSFPTLLWLGLPAVSANATNAVALWPGSAAAAWGFRRDISGSGRRWYWLALPALLGGGAGAILLLHTPAEWFRGIAPFLVIGASLLMGVEGALRARFAPRPRTGTSAPRLAGAALAQFAIALYGGYFGAGIGILLLISLGLMGISDLHRANGFKNLYSVAIKGVAVAYFVFAGAVVWSAALLMALGALLGGYGGAAVGRRVEQATMRRVIVGLGLLLGLLMLVRLG